MLYEFLVKKEIDILKLTERKSLELAGVRPSSDQLESGLPIFFRQLTETLKVETNSEQNNKKNDIAAMAIAAGENDEPALASASIYPGDVSLAHSAGHHGIELFRLGYTLSHVVHAYGSMCQAITELATLYSEPITSHEFHSLNRCLDVAIAGAVTQFQAQRNTHENAREIEHLGSLAHELRNALSTISMSFEIIKDGAVGVRGNTGKILEKGINRMSALIDRSLTEVRLRVDPKVYPESIKLLLLINQIAVTANLEAKSKNQFLEIRIDPDLVIEADHQLMYSAISNLIQNAIKYSRFGGKILVSASVANEIVLIEIQDECGGLSGNEKVLFKPFEQHNENRSGLGLGLTIAERAVKLNNGSLKVQDLPGKGCIFTISLPNPNFKNIVSKKNKNF